MGPLNTVVDATMVLLLELVLESLVGEVVVKKSKSNLQRDNFNSSSNRKELIWR